VLPCDVTVLCTRENIALSLQDKKKTGFSRETAHGVGGLIDIWIETNESMELLLLDFSVQPVSVLLTAVRYHRVFSLFQYCFLL
jgi:hypothetical protein